MITAVIFAAIGIIFLQTQQVLCVQMAQLTGLNVTCNEDSMEVELTFDGPFNGIVFSKGHYKDPSCRYVEPNTTDQSWVSFRILAGQCGSTWVEDTEKRALEATLVVQGDPHVQEAWDMVRRVRCYWPLLVRRQLHFRPLSIAPLEVQKDTFQAEGLACWMDVQVGEGNVVDGPVHLGETLSLVVHASDTDATIDIQVKDCYASPSPDPIDNDTSLALSDSRGCPLRPKLMGPFYRTRELNGPERNASVMAFALINAFAFPDEEHVYLSCHVTVCRGPCPEASPCTQDVLADPRYHLPLPPPPLVGPPPQRRILGRRKIKRAIIHNAPMRLQRSIQVLPIIADHPSQSKSADDTPCWLTVPVAMAFGAMVTLQFLTCCLVFSNLLKKRSKYL